MEKGFGSRYCMVEVMRRPTMVFGGADGGLEMGWLECMWNLSGGRWKQFWAVGGGLVELYQRFEFTAVEHILAEDTTMLNQRAPEA